MYLWQCVSPDNSAVESPVVVSSPADTWPGGGRFLLQYKHVVYQVRVAAREAWVLDLARSVVGHYLRLTQHTPSRLVAKHQLYLRVLLFTTCKQPYPALGDIHKLCNVTPPPSHSIESVGEICPSQLLPHLTLWNLNSLSFNPLSTMGRLYFV